jgi:uncharacterized membrane protein
MSSDPGRRLIRYGAALLAAGAAVVYVLIGFEVIKVIDTKSPDMVSLLPFGLLSGGAFLLGAILLFLFDRRILWIAGGLFQVFAIAMYVAVAPQRDPSYEPWGIGLKVAQAILLVALVYLATRRPRAPMHAAARRIRR